MEATATECAAREQAQRLFDEHQGLARVIAKEWVKRLHRPDLYQDFEQAGLLGLWDAAQKYDPARGIAFATFAPHRIRGQILDWIRLERGRGPEGKMSQSRFESSMRSIDQVIRWDSSHGNRTHKDKTLADLIVAPQEPDVLALRETVRKLLAALPVRQRCVLRSYYLDEVVIREAADREGISKSRTSQIITQSLNRLKEDFAGEEF